MWRWASCGGTPRRTCVRSPKTRARPSLQNLQTTSYVQHTRAEQHLEQLCQQGKNLIHLIDRKDEPYCFRLHKDKVYYVSEASMRLSISVARPNLVTLGTCFGKFSKTGKFKLHVTALDHIAQYAKYKVYFPSIQRSHLTFLQRFGSSPMAKCPFCMATMSSKHTLAE